MSPSDTTDAHLFAFVEARLRSGVEPSELKRLLRTQGITDDGIRRVMGPAYDGRRPSAAADHVALAALPLTMAIHPDIIRVPTSKAQIYSWKNFLSHQECERIIKLTDQCLRQSTTVDVFGDPKMRTSRTSDIGILDHPDVRQVDDRIVAGLGLHWSYSEPTQAQRYDLGQEFKPHHDYFVPGTHEHKVYCQLLGQRTWTFMVYLNDVDEGGGTRFRKIDRIFQPQRGKALIWNNLNPDGSINPNTQHQGMKVRAGVKYVITKWFRERGWGDMFLAQPPP
jgi:prolyl 4-hydroxylase